MKLFKVLSKISTHTKNKLTFLKFLFSPTTPIYARSFNINNIDSINNDDKVNHNKIGSRTIALYDQERSRPILIEFFYPADQNSKVKEPLGSNLWKRMPEARNAPLLIPLNLSSTNHKRPLILFSHGHGGSRIESVWLCYELVKQGYLVASIDHFRNTWDLIEEEEAWKRWHRAQDISFAIRELLKMQDIGQYIDEHRIGFAGFSLGGLTGIWLAGGRANLIKNILKDEPNILANMDINRAKQSYMDPLIKAVFLMAPAYAFAFDPESLKKITTPMYIIAGESDKVVPKTNSEHLHQWIPNCQLKILPGKVGHYVFLNLPTTLGKILLPKEIILEQASCSITKMHKQIADEAVRFFDHYLRNSVAA